MPLCPPLLPTQDLPAGDVSYLGDDDVLHSGEEAEAAGRRARGLRGGRGGEGGSEEEEGEEEGEEADARGSGATLAALTEIFRDFPPEVCRCLPW